MQTYGAISMTSVVKEIICARDERHLVMTGANMTFLCILLKTGADLSCNVLYSLKVSQINCSNELIIVGLKTVRCVIQAPMKSIIRYFTQSFGRSLCNQHVTQSFQNLLNSSLVPAQQCPAES